MNESDRTTARAQALARNIRQARRWRDITQEQLAQMMHNHHGWSRLTVTKLETGQRQLLAVELDTLCEVLQVAYDDLLVLFDPRREDAA